MNTSQDIFSQSSFGEAGDDFRFREDRTACGEIYWLLGLQGKRSDFIQADTEHAGDDLQKSAASGSTFLIRIMHRVRPEDNIEEV